MKKIRGIPVYGLLILIVLMINLPLLNMLGTSFKPSADVLSDNHIIPEVFSIENYKNVLSLTSYFTYLGNSFVNAVVVTAVSTIVACLAGYAMSRFREKLRFIRIYSNILLALQMFPAVLLLIPLFIAYRNYGIVDTRWSVMLTYGTFSLPFCIWMLQGFFDGIPLELEEAGRIDGCSQFQTFLRLVMPISSPGIASVGIFTFIYCWNEYLFASIFLRTDSVRTLPIGLRNFIQQYSTDWGSLMAASAMTIVPVVIFLIFMQKYIVQGLTAGAVKG